MTTEMTNGGDPDGREEAQNLREAYTFARETRDQADTLIWELGAIVWGGQTLLIGFVLEAIDGGIAALILILVVALIGILMARFNEGVMDRRSRVCNQMIEIMRDIEVRLLMPVKPQQMLSEAYPAGFQRRWYSRLNTSFQVAWGFVFVVATCRLFRVLCALLHRSCAALRLL